MLKADYPAFYIAFCKSLGLQKEIDNYIKECMRLRDAEPEKYELYIHGGMLPTLQKQRDAGMLKKGNSHTHLLSYSLAVNVAREDGVPYCGEMNSAGYPHGRAYLRGFKKEENVTYENEGHVFLGGKASLGK